MKSSFVKAVVAGSLLGGLSVLPALAAFKLDGDPKVAMIIFAQKNDGGWSQSFDEARQRMEKSLGITIPFVENVPENATAIRPPAELFIGKGYNIIIGSAFGYSDTFKELSEKYPNVAFLNGAGTTNGPNLESFYGRTYESAVSLRHGRRRRFEDRQARLRRRQSVRPRQLDGQRLRDGRQADQSERDHHGDLHRRLERPGQGARRRRSPDRAGHRRHRPARRHAGAADRRPGEGRVEHRPPPRPVRVRAERDAVLVGLGVGQVPRAGDREDQVGHLGAEPLRRLLRHRQRHRHRLLRRPGLGREQGQDHGRAPGDHRRQADLCRPAQRPDGKEKVPAGGVLGDGDLWRWTGTSTG